MATIEIEIDEQKIQQLLRGDRGMAVLLEPILNQIIRAEMTEHLKAKPGEQTDDRRGQKNGTYERKLTTRVGTIELEVPRDREGTFFGGPVSALSAEREGARPDADADGGSRSQHRSSQGDHHRALRARVFKVDGLAIGEGPR
jgi:hypothetical protein